MLTIRPTALKGASLQVAENNVVDSPESIFPASLLFQVETSTYNVVFLVSIICLHWLHFLCEWIAVLLDTTRSLILQPQILIGTKWESEQSNDINIYCFPSITSHSHCLSNLLSFLWMHLRNQEDLICSTLFQAELVFPFYFVERSCKTMSWNLSWKAALGVLLSVTHSVCPLPSPYASPCSFQIAFLDWHDKKWNPPKKCNADSKSQS